MNALDTSLLYGVAHHLYERGSDGVWDWRSPGPDSYTDSMYLLAEATEGLPLFQTEFSTDEDNFTDGGFETAWLIHHSLVAEGVSGWLYWDLVWRRSGLVALDGEEYTLRDQYHAVRHFARFTDPGYVRVKALPRRGEVLVSAFLSPDESECIIVLLNPGATDENLSLDLEACAGSDSAAYRTVFRAGETEAWREVGLLEEGARLDLPTRAVVTIVSRR